MPLVVVDHRGAEPTPAALAMLALARRLAGSAAAIVFGPESEIVAAVLGAAGADVTFTCADPAVDADLGQAQASVVETAVRTHGITSILLENSGAAAELAASLAVRLDAGVDWDLQDLAIVDGRLVGQRLALNDTTAVDVAWTSDVRICVFRLGVLEEPDAPEPGAGRIERLEATVPGYAQATRVVERRPTVREGVDLANADIIVAGGRGMHGPETLQLLEGLAEALGGAVAVSMPIVDRGWAPRARQVGQTGNRVRPRLYLACGISGQLAHRVGMEKSRLIVAINADATAPIFGICDAGVVGDLHEIVPELTRLVRDARARVTS
jgi:electron transfer flavoprotein alpha subunit